MCLKKSRNETRGKSLIVYQVRTLPGSGPQVLLDDLANALWKSLEKTVLPKRLDPHRWPDVRELIHRVLARRLVRYEDCGHLDTCHPAPEHVYWPNAGTPGARTEIHLLELRRDVDRLVSAVTALIHRQYRHQSMLSRSDWYGWELGARAQLRKVLGNYLFYSSRCADCRARQGAKERRIWEPHW